MDEYRVALPEFHGPLDLLLFLVKKNEVDIRDIPIATIAEQFRTYLDTLGSIDVELAGDFLVTAATLMEIKSRMLLPRAEVDSAMAESAEDPRRELVKQLLEYKRFKEAAGRLEARAADRERHLPRTAAAQPTAPTATPVRPVELWDLVSAFGRIMEEAAALAPDNVIEDDTPQHVYREQVAGLVSRHARLEFRALFTPPFHKSRLIGLFLAVLELIKEGAIRLEQDDPFGDIWLVAGLHGLAEENPERGQVG